MKFTKLVLSLVLSLGLLSACSSSNNNNAEQKTTGDTQKESQDKSQDKTQEEGKKENQNKSFATLEEIKAKGSLVMGTNAAFPPFEYVEGGGKITGFDVEIAEKVAGKIGVPLEIKDMEFDNLIIELSIGKIDLAAAGISITEAKQKEADFSEPYFDAKQVVIVREDNDTIKTTEDLKGKKVGVQTATTGEQTARKHVDEVISYDTIFQGVMDLQSGKVDVLVIDNEPAINIVGANKDSDKPLKYLEIGFEEEKYGIAVTKGNTELKAVIDEVLKELHDSGEYARLIEKYFTK